MAEEEELDNVIRALVRERDELKRKSNDQDKIFWDKAGKDEDEQQKQIAKLENDMSEKLRTFEELRNKLLEMKKQFTEHQSSYETNKKRVLNLLENIKGFERSISKARSEQNKEQLRGKKRNLAGNAFGLFGVLAAPASGGLSLSLTLVSTTIGVYGVVNEFACKDFDKEISDITNKFRSTQKSILERFDDMESTIREMEDIIKRYADIRIQISIIFESVSSRSYIEKVVKIGLCAHKMYKDTMALYQLCFQPAKVVRGTEAAKCICKMKEIAGSQKSVSQGAEAAKGAGKVKGAVASRKGLSQSAKAAKYSGNVKGCPRSKQSLSQSSKTAKGISKFSLGLSIGFVCYDAYKLYNHSEQKAQAEIDIAYVIKCTYTRLNDMDLFVSEAKSTFDQILKRCS